MLENYEKLMNLQNVHRTGNDNKVKQSACEASVQSLLEKDLADFRPTGAITGEVFKAKACLCDASRDLIEVINYLTQ